MGGVPEAYRTQFGQNMRRQSLARVPATGQGFERHLAMGCRGPQRAAGIGVIQGLPGLKHFACRHKSQWEMFKIYHCPFVEDYAIDCGHNQTWKRGHTVALRAVWRGLAACRGVVGVVAEKATLEKCV